MLSLIGFIVLWPIATTIISMIINTIRAKAGLNINDPLSEMFTGLIWGPIGILMGLNPINIHRIIGGIVGTWWAYTIYHEI